jgi:hypothetical protein
MGPGWGLWKFADKAFLKMVLGIAQAPVCLSNGNFFENFTGWYKEKGQSIYNNENTASIEQFMYQRSAEIDA